MLLSEWIERNGRGAVSRLARETGLAYTTVYYPAKHGNPVKTYRIAQLISEATDGEVSITELCDPDAREAVR